MQLGIYPEGTIVDGRYRIERRLGRGGFATVYKAEHLQLGRPAALKVLEPVAPHISERFQARFNSEARIAANLDHPNVVRIFDFGFIEGDQRPYMAMELLLGCDLEEYLKRAGPMDPERAKRLFLPVLDALRVGHERGIVHKDLKPANLFFVNEGTPQEKLVVLDYGIARLEGDDNPRHTEEGTYTGTPAYMPPEYIHRREVTPAYDVYQIGLIFIETMTGQPVVVAGSQIAYMVAHVEGKRNLPEGFGDTPLGAALLGALEIEPANRYADAGALCAAIEATSVASGTDFTLTDMPAVAIVPVETDPGAGRERQIPRKKSSSAPMFIMAALFFLCAAGCVVTSIAAVAFFANDDEEAWFDPDETELATQMEPEVVRMPTMPKIGMPSDEGQEMNAWLLSRYMVLTILNQVTLYESTLEKTGGWSKKGAAFVPTGVDDLMGVAWSQIQAGMQGPPHRKVLESQTTKLRPKLEKLQGLLNDLYDYHSVRRGWESDQGAHGKELTRQLAGLVKQLQPEFDRWSDAVDSELMKSLARAEDDASGDPFLQLATRGMIAEARLISAMVEDPTSKASNAALSKYDSSLDALEGHIRANRPALVERYQITGGLHDRFLGALKDTRKQAGELRADAAEGDTSDKGFLMMQLHMTYSAYTQLERF